MDPITAPAKGKLLADFLRHGWHVFRSGPGVTGRLTHIAVAALFFGVLFAWPMETDSARLIVFGGVVTVVLLAGIGILWFGQKHPNQAMTEGGDFVRAKEIDQLAAMNRPITIDATPVPDPLQLPDAPAPPEREPRDGS